MHMIKIKKNIQGYSHQKLINKVITLNPHKLTHQKDQIHHSKHNNPNT